MKETADLSEVLGELEDVLGETIGTASASGYANWGGFYSHSATSAWAGIPAQPEKQAQAWPYRTKAAQVVWKTLKDIERLHTDKTDIELIQLAVHKSGVRGMDLTAEDWRLLEMATEWYRNGTLYVKPNRIGGAPGGPADHYDAQHFLRGKGTP